MYQDNYALGVVPLFETGVSPAVTSGCWAGAGCLDGWNSETHQVPPQEHTLQLWQLLLIKNMRGSNISQENSSHVKHDSCAWIIIKTIWVNCVKFELKCSNPQADMGRTCKPHRKTPAELGFEPRTLLLLGNHYILYNKNDHIQSWLVTKNRLKH